MKEIIAIIRPKKVAATKDALEKAGFPGITATPVLGRGRQRGIAAELSFNIDPELLSKGKTGGMKYIPKRFINIVVGDEDVQTVVDTIIKVNQTAQIGDGKIFVMPIDNAIRVRTSETGDSALV
jgi:nitrogen regulatory protein PII 2